MAAPVSIALGALTTVSATSPVASVNNSITFPGNLRFFLRPNFCKCRRRCFMFFSTTLFSPMARSVSKSSSPSNQVSTTLWPTTTWGTWSSYRTGRVASEILSCTSRKEFPKWSSAFGWNSFNAGLANCKVMLRLANALTYTTQTSTAQASFLSHPVKAGKSWLIFKFW